MTAELWDLIVRLTIFTMIPLVILGLMMIGTGVAEQKGWIVRRKKPTETELAMRELSAAIDDLMDEIGKALLPPIESLAREMNHLFGKKR